MVKSNDYMIEYIQQQVQEALKLAEKELMKVKDDTENLINVYTTLHNMDKPK